MQLIWVFIGLVWFGVQERDGIKSYEPPVMYTEKMDTKKECDDMSDSFKKGENMIQDPQSYFLVDSECVEVTASWADRDPVKGTQE